MDSGYYLLVLAGLLCGTQSAAVVEETPTPQNNDATSYESLLDRFWHQSTVARRNTPPFDEQGQVAVKYGMSLIDIREINPDTGVAELLVWEQMNWTDNRMTWCPEENGGINDLRVPHTMIWKPDIMTYNSFMTDDIETRSDVNVVVSSDGGVVFIPPSYKQIRCDMNEAKDVASCKMKIGSWTFNGHQLDLNFYDTAALDLNQFHTSSLVPRIDNNSATRNVVTYECCPESYVDLTFNFDIVLGGGAEEAAVKEAGNADEENADMEEA